MKRVTLVYDSGVRDSTVTLGSRSSGVHVNVEIISEGKYGILIQSKEGT